jgi:SAM-dependent methyltransferase
VSDTSTPDDALSRAIVDAAAPTPSRDAGLVTRLIARLSSGVIADRAARQHRVDAEIAARLAELGRGRDGLAADLAEMRDRLTEIRDWLAATSARGDELGGAVTALGDSTQVQLQRLDLLVASDSLLGHDHFETFTAATGETVIGFRGDQREEGELYRGFEDVFRGSEQEIRDRQRAYLPVLGGHPPVLDVGCGRGELLELLHDAEVPARGVDLDEGMVRHCQDKGLDVRDGDALAAVTDVAAGALGSIVAAQVIEHLPYAELTAFFRAARVALVPGGVVLLETVNPHHPQALKHFWIDPTHQHPLFPEVVLTLLRLSGFAQGYIWYPAGSGDPERDRVEQPDFSIVATTP